MISVVLFILCLLIISFVLYKTFSIPLIKPNKYKPKYKSKHIKSKLKRNIHPLVLNEMTYDDFIRWETEYKKDSDKKQLTNIVSSNSLHKSFINREVLENLHHSYSNKTPLISNITNQRNSGRCWIFSFLNLIKQELMVEKQLSKDFELSENYLFFFDKLEKSQFFLHSIFLTKDKKIEDREVDYLLKQYMSDGGTWNMLVNLIKKYGCIPKSAMRDTFHSGYSRELNKCLKQHLKELAFYIRTKKNLDFNRFLKHEMHSIFNMLVLFLGLPPKQFDWEYSEKSNKEEANKISKDYKIVYDLTPHQFSEKYLKFNPEDWIVCGNFPMEKYPFYIKYNIKFCNNMVGGVTTNIYNIPIDTMIELTKKTIDNGQSVWFASDFGKYNNKDYSLLHHNVYTYPCFHNALKVSMSKGEKLEYKIINPNHAMLIRGYNKTKRGIDRWLVENSHGEKNGNNLLRMDKNMQADGYYNMSDGWFREHVIQVVIPKKVCSYAFRHQYDNAKSQWVHPWESMECQLLKT